MDFLPPPPPLNLPPPPGMDFLPPPPPAVPVRFILTPPPNNGELIRLSSATSQLRTSVANARAVVDNATKIVMAPKITLDPGELAGKSIAILGANGSGKSRTARRIMEECLRLGIPFAVADIENEYITLKEVGDVILAGPPADYGSFKLDVALANSSGYYECGRNAFLESKTVILLIGELKDDDVQDEFLRAFTDGIFEAANDPQKQHDFKFFLEEAQEHVPQSGSGKGSDLSKSLIRMAKRGRKRKLSVVPISQRPAAVSKDLLTQCHVHFLHKVLFPTDFNVYAQQFNVADSETWSRSAVPGDVIFRFGQHDIQDHIIQATTISPWDRSSTFDASKFREVDVTEMRERVHASEDVDSGMSTVQTTYLRDLEHQVVQLSDRIEELVTEIDQRNSLPTLPPPPGYLPPPPPSGDSEAALRVEIAQLREQLSRAKRQGRILDDLATLLHDR